MRRYKAVVKMAIVELKRGFCLRNSLTTSGSPERGYKG